MFQIKDPKTAPKPDAMSMMLKAMGIDLTQITAKFMPMFEDAKSLIVGFTETMERNQRDIVDRLERCALAIDAMSERMEILHADVRALNPDHAGAIDAAVEIAMNGELTLSERFAIEIDKKHWEEHSLELQTWLNSRSGESLSEMEWMEYRANARANRSAN